MVRESPRTAISACHSLALRETGSVSGQKVVTSKRGPCLNVKLKVEEQRRVAQSANWYFDVYLGQGTGDSVVFTGDGVDDLDRLISVIAAGTGIQSRFLCDVSAASYSEYRAFDLEDVQAIKSYFIGWYGTVAKPNAYTASAGVALPLATSMRVGSIYSLNGTT